MPETTTYAEKSLTEMREHVHVADEILQHLILRAIDDERVIKENEPALENIRKHFIYVKDILEATLKLERKACEK